MKTLVVDEEFASRHFLQGILSQYGTCDAALNGQAALEAISAAWEENDPYDLICLDLLVSGRSGHEVLREIRRREAERGVDERRRARVIVITASLEPEHVLQAFEERCDAYLVKPVVGSNLLEKLGEFGLLPWSPIPRP